MKNFDKQFKKLIENVHVSTSFNKQTTKQIKPVKVRDKKLPPANKD